LQAGVRLLPHPTPAALSARLAARFPSREGNGVPSFTSPITRGAGRASRPVARHPRQGTAEAPAPGHSPVGPSLSAPLACRTSRPLTALHGVLTLPRAAGPRLP